ncbi:MAG TPA: extracellular solute-binding protein [Aggregatilineales bacterium]|nr:extracellular solute-binding protein [Aggregatilineales bacterium]
MRKLILLSLILVLTVSMVGISSAQDMSGVDPSGQTVVYWHQYNSGAQLETMTALVADFNANNEWGITVEALAQGSVDEIRELMNGAIISGELPNLVAGFLNDAFSYHQDEAVIDINPYYTDPTWGFTEEELANLNTSILDSFLIGETGERLGLPNQVSANVLVVNTGMLADLGFDGPPETFEAWMEVACAAAAAGGDNKGYPIKGGASDFESYLAGMGGNLFHDGAWDFTSEAAVAVLQMYHDVYANDCAYVPDSAFGNTDDFALGLNPMGETSTAGIPFIISGMAEAGYETEWVVTTTPWTEGNRAIQPFISAILMGASTPEAELASWLFLKYFLTTGSQVTWTLATSYFPINLEAAASLGDFETTNPFFAQANALISDPDINIYLSPQTLAYGSIRPLIQQAVADVTSNGRDVMEVATELEEAANAVQADLE